MHDFSPEVEKIGKGIIEREEHFSYLKEFEIAWLVYKSTTDSIGMSIKQGEMAKLLGNYDAVIKVDTTAWDTLSESDKEALIAHELCHLQIDENRNLKLIKRHDLEEFNFIIEKYGLWTDSLRRFGEKYEQLSLKLERKKKKAS